MYCKFSFLLFLLALESYAVEESQETTEIKSASISLVDYIKSQNKHGKRSKKHQQNGLGIIGKENNTGSLGLLRKAPSTLNRSVSSSASDIVWSVSEETRESGSLEYMAQLAGYLPTEKYLDQDIVDAVMQQKNAHQAFQKIIDSRLSSITSLDLFEEIEKCDARDLYYKSIFDLNHWITKRYQDFEFNTSYVRFGDVSESILSAIQARKEELLKVNLSK